LIQALPRFAEQMAATGITTFPVLDSRTGGLIGVVGS